MNVSTNFDLRKLLPVYEETVNRTREELAVNTALLAVLAGSCSSVVVLSGLDLLAWNFENWCDLCDVERAERYVEECWLEYVAGHPPVPPVPGSGELFSAAVVRLAARRAECSSERPPESCGALIAA